MKGTAAGAVAGASEGRTRLSYAGAEIDVCAEPSAIAWLVEFLSPAFTTSGDAPHALRQADVARVEAGALHRVSFRVAAEEHARLGVLLAAAPARTLDVFTLDGSFARHPFFERGDECWVHDARHRVFLGIHGGGRGVEIVAPDENPRHRLVLMRALRELAITAALRRGALPVHASAFVLDGCAVLVCGRKRAGKSSVLVHALERGAAYLSNDRVVVSLDGAPLARAMPTIAMLRDGTLGFFDELRRAFEREQLDVARTLEECAPGIARPPPRVRPGADRAGLSPAQLCHLLRAPLWGAAPVRALLFPRVDPEARGLHLAPLPPRAAASLLADSLLKPSHPTRTSEAFAADAERLEVPPSVEASRREALASAVPAWTCRLGPDAYDGDLPGALRVAMAQSGRVS